MADRPHAATAFQDERRGRDGMNRPHGLVQPVHETGPVARRRRVHGRPRRERLPDRLQLFEATAAVGASANVGRGPGAFGRLQLAVKVEDQVDVAGHTRPPVVTRALHNAARSRCTAACS